MDSKLHLARDICMVRVNEDGTIAEVILHDWVTEAQVGHAGTVMNVQRCTVCSLMIAHPHPEEQTHDRPNLPGH